MRKPTDEDIRPKRPKSGFEIFAGEHRDAIKAQNSELGYNKISSIISKKWKDLEEEDRDAFWTKSNDLMEIYEHELKEYYESDAFRDFKERLDKYLKEREMEGKDVKSKEKDKTTV